MQFTMKEVLELDILKPAKVRTAVNQLKNYPVKWISVMEYPVEKYIRKNEFVLSTAIGCNEDLTVFQNFVRDVIESGASGMAIALGRYVQKIPQEVLQLAEEHEFPIVELPWSIRFTDIIQAVLSGIHHWHRGLLKRSGDLQKQLLHLFLNRGSLSDAADVIRQEIGSPVVIMDKDGTIKGKSHDANDWLEKWDFRSHSPGKLTQEKCPPHLPENSMVQLKIKSEDKLQGYLLITPRDGPSAESVRSYDKESVSEHILTAIALWFQREYAILETEMRLKDEFVWNLAKGEVDSWDMVLSRAKSLDFNLQVPYVCILGFTENLEKTVQGKIRSTILRTLAAPNHSLDRRTTEKSRGSLATENNDHLSTG